MLLHILLYNRSSNNDCLNKITENVPAKPVYTLDEQCQLKFGTSSKHCPISFDKQVCSYT